MKNLQFPFEIAKSKKFHFDEIKVISIDRKFSFSMINSMIFLANSLKFLFIIFSFFFIQKELKRRKDLLNISFLSNFIQYEKEEKIFIEQIRLFSSCNRLNERIFISIEYRSQILTIDYS